MREKTKHIVTRYGPWLCSLVLTVAPMATSVCRGRYYQPKEPEGMTEFILASKKSRRKS